MKTSLVFLLAGVLAIGVTACKPKCESTDSGAAPTACHETANKTACEATAKAQTAVADAGQLIADYQKFADQYIAAAQKAKTGDLSAISSLPGLSKNWQEWSKKVEDVAASLTLEQKQQLQTIAENIKNSLAK